MTYHYMANFTDWSNAYKMGVTGLTAGALGGVLYNSGKILTNPPNKEEERAANNFNKATTEYLGDKPVRFTRKGDSPEGDRFMKAGEDFDKSVQSRNERLGVINPLIPGAALGAVGIGAGLLGVGKKWHV